MSDSPTSENFADEASQSSALGDAETVRLAYSREILRTAELLNSGLSVLVNCEKLISGHLWQDMVARSGRHGHLAEAWSDSTSSAVHSSYPLGYPYLHLSRLRELIEGKSSPNDVVVLLHLDLIADRSGMVPAGAVGELVELLYGATDQTFLGFADPSVPLPDVLASRFAARVTLQGIPREIWYPNDNSVHSLSAALLTADEAARCVGVESTDLHRNVAGLNPIRFRQAIQYAMRNNSGNIAAQDLYRSIREFKALSSPSRLSAIPTATFHDIGGYDDVKKEIMQRLAFFTGVDEGRSDLAWLRNELLPHALLLYGPPGTGKTTIAHAIASIIDAQIMLVSGPEILGWTPEDTERTISEIFSEARRNAPTVLVLDEFDAIAAQRSARILNPDDERSRQGTAVIDRVAAEVDRASDNVPVLIIGITNRVDLIDDSLLRPRRFLPIAVNLPDQEDRQAIIRIYAGKCDMRIDDDLMTQMAVRTRGFTGDEICSLFREAALAAYRQNTSPTTEIIAEILENTVQQRSLLGPSLRQASD